MNDALDLGQERSCSSVDSPKEYSEAFMQAKKRRKALKRKIDSMNSRDVSPSSSENSMTFNVVSSRDSTKNYTVRILNSASGFTFSCNCGDQYGVPTRDHCRHIGTVITSMLGKYVDLCFKKPKSNGSGTVQEMAVSDLENMFANFLQISDRRYN